MGEEVQGQRNAEPVFAIVTPAIFRKEKWVPADDGEEKQDNEVGDEDDIYKLL